MSETVIVAIIALVGTVLGSLGGILTANRLSNYRIEQLEVKVDKHNQLVSRMYQCEESISLLNAEKDRVNARLRNLEEGHK